MVKVKRYKIISPLKPTVMKKNKGQDAVNAKRLVMSAVTDRIRIVRRYRHLLPHIPIDNECDTIVYFPETFLSLASDKGKIIITGRDIPQLFTATDAHRLSQTVCNGLGQRPQTIKRDEFYKLYSEWLQSQRTSIEALFN